MPRAGNQNTNSKHNLGVTCYLQFESTINIYISIVKFLLKLDSSAADNLQYQQY